MKIAILLPGQPRFTEDFRLFLSNIKGYYQADWFVYITNNNVPTKENVKIASSWGNFDSDWAYEKIKSMLPVNNVIRSYQISDADLQVFPPVNNLFQVLDSNVTFKMFYNIYRADQARQQYEQTHNFKYDLVIRTRADLGLESEVNLRDLNITENQIVMPTNGWHGSPAGNDQFAIGRSKEMSIYGTLYTRIKEYNNKGLHFHPESMVAHNLSVHNIQVRKGQFIADIRRHPMIEN
jgi:hypothetical protein